MVAKSPPRLIGLCSPCMGSGKSSFAQRLVSKHPKWANVKFAAPLKMMADALLRSARLPVLARREMLEGGLKEAPIEALGGITPRTLLQTLGTEWGRNTLGEDFWVKATMPTVDALLAGGFSVVIDDLRFPNEADAITDRGGQLIRVIRPDAQPYRPHASEGGLDGRAMPEIFNGGDLADLHALADRLARGELF